MEQVEAGERVGHAFQKGPTCPLLDACRASGFLVVMAPLHKHSQRLDLWKAMLQSLWSDPVHQIRAYYGEEVGLCKLLLLTF